MGSVERLKQPVWDVDGGYMSKDAKPEDKRNAAWTAEDFQGLMVAGKPLLDEWIQYQRDRDAAMIDRLKAISKHNRRLSTSLIVFLLVVVGGMGVLTYAGKVSGDALLFLVGTVTGYVALMVQDLTQPMFASAQEDR